MSYIPRLIEKKLTHFIKNEQPPFNVILLSGARQCGKSTLLKQLFPAEGHIHVNFSEDAALCEAMDQTNNFDDFTTLIQSRLRFELGHPDRVLVFDEAQLSKKIGSYIRFMKEKWQTQRVILTGSTLSQLFTNAEKPTGRVVEFVLRPFNFIEFLNCLDVSVLCNLLKSWTANDEISETAHQEIVKYLQYYLTIGGLPEVVLAFKQKGDYQRLLSNIFAFYKRDYEEKISVENVGSIISQIYLKVAAATGSSLKMSSIIKSSSPGYKKIPAVLSIMEQWHQIVRVDSEMSAHSKIGTQAPKRYIFDHGIRYMQYPGLLGGANFLENPPIDTTALGGIIENFVLTEILSTDLSTPVRSWSKTNQSGHIDFLLGLAHNTLGIEVKSAQYLNQKHLTSLKSFLDEYPNAQGVLVSLNRISEEITYKTKKIITLPVYCLWAYLHQMQG